MNIQQAIDNIKDKIERLDKDLEKYKKQRNSLQLNNFTLSVCDARQESKQSQLQSLEIALEALQFVHELNYEQEGRKYHTEEWLSISEMKDLGLEDRL